MIWKEEDPNTAEIKLWNARASQSLEILRPISKSQKIRNISKSETKNFELQRLKERINKDDSNRFGCRLKALNRLALKFKPNRLDNSRNDVDIIK